MTRLTLAEIRLHYWWISQRDRADEMTRRERVREAVWMAEQERKEADAWTRMEEEWRAGVEQANAIADEDLPF